MTEEANPQEVDLEVADEEKDPEIPAVEKPKRGRPKLPSAEKKVRKAASNKSYYEGIRQKIKQADKPASPEPSPPKKKQPPPSPEPSPPKRKAKPRPAKPEPSPPKRKAKPRPAKPEPSPPKRKARPKPAYSPSSPRSKLVAAYREARLHQQEQKIQRYRSWFE